MNSAVSADLPRRKSWTLTATAVVFLLGGLALAGQIALSELPGLSHATPPLSYALFLLLVACAPLLLVIGSLMIVRRWRGWRVWAGAIAWSTIAFGSGLIRDLMESVYNAPNVQAVTEAPRRLAFAAIPVCLAALLLWAKRRERPVTAEGHRSIEVSLAAICQLLLATLCALDAIRIGAQLTDLWTLEGHAFDLSPLPFDVLVYRFCAEIVLTIWLGYAGITAFRRSEDWSTWTAAAALLIVVASAGYTWMIYRSDPFFQPSDSAQELLLCGGLAYFLFWASRTRRR